VDFVQRSANPDRGGEFVRISHRDGTVFSWYFHLAAIPRALVAKEFLSPLWVQQSRVAMLRGDLAATHAYADRDGPPTIPDDVPTVSVSGRVVDGANRPVAGATVVAWNNLLVGDAKRVHVGGFNGARATSDAAGNFTMTAPRGGGIIAEVEGQRSRPHSITSEPVALVLEPTRTITGTVESDDASRGGLVVFATVRLGSKTAWSVGTPVDRAGGYRLAGIPPGDSVIILDYLADPNRSRRWLAFGPPRDGMTLRWRSGVTLDVIVRGMADDPTIRVFRGRVAPKTRAEVDKLGEAMSNIVAHDAFVIGIGDQTPEGMKEYRDDVRSKMLAHGRKPDECKVLFLVSPILASTDDEAQERRKVDANDPLFFEQALAGISSVTDIDFSQFDLDEPLPELTTNGERGSLDKFAQWGSGKTLRELVIDRIDRSIDLCGSPDTVAAKMGEVMEEVGGDGFLITAPNMRVSRRYVTEITEGLSEGTVVITSLEKQGVKAGARVVARGPGGAGADSAATKRTAASTP